jgi:hypothetical protein
MYMTSQKTWKQDCKLWYLPIIYIQHLLMVNTWIFKGRDLLQGSIFQDCNFPWGGKSQGWEVGGGFSGQIVHRGNFLGFINSYTEFFCFLTFSKVITFYT